MELEVSEEEIKDLIAKSNDAKERAFAPYSNFKVGAALLTVDGRIFTGCNVENCAYPLSTCAERCAIVKAVSEGCSEFKAIAVSIDRDVTPTPCGGCRQIMSEFAKKDYLVILAKADGSYDRETVYSLLPRSFSSHDLQ